MSVVRRRVPSDCGARRAGQSLRRLAHAVLVALAGLVFLLISLLSPPLGAEFLDALGPRRARKDCP
jgi:hypothetical protein